MPRGTTVIRISAQGYRGHKKQWVSGTHEFALMVVANEREPTIRARAERPWFGGVSGVKSAYHKRFRGSKVRIIKGFGG